MGDDSNPMLSRLDQMIELLRTIAAREKPRPRRLLRLKDASEVYSISRKKLRALIQAKEIPVIRNGDGSGGVWLIDSQDLDRWVARAKE